MDPLRFLFENPLIVAGVIGLISALAYISAESRYMRHKTRELKKSILRGWGLLLVIMALLSLFTTSWHVILENTKVISPSPTGYATLEQANKLCSTGSFQRCDIVNYGYWGSIAAVAIGIILIIAGSIKIRQEIKSLEKEKKEEQKKD